MENGEGNSGSMWKVENTEVSKILADYGAVLIQKVRYFPSGKMEARYIAFTSMPIRHFESDRSMEDATNQLVEVIRNEGPTTPNYSRSYPQQ